MPLGGGSEAATAVTTLRAIQPDIEIYAVQASSSRAAHRSWQAGRPLSAQNENFAGGFATGQAFDLPFSIYKDGLAGFVTLSEEVLYAGIALALFHTYNLAEWAGAATIMATIHLTDKLRGKRVVLQVSGCNASAEDIATAIDRPEFSSGSPGKLR